MDEAIHAVNLFRLQVEEAAQAMMKNEITAGFGELLTKNAKDLNARLDAIDSRSSY